MQKILFGIVGWNIAETTRMIEVARIFKHDYECHFFSYGGQFEYLVEEAGYTLHHLSPIEDNKKIQHLWKVDRGESFRQPWTLQELDERIKNEISLIDHIQPSFAFLGSVLTFSMSCKIRNIKLFNVIPLALSGPYLNAGLPISPFWPKWVNHIARFVFLHIPLFVGNFRKIARKYNLTVPKNALDVWTGDVNIVADVKEFSLLKVLPNNWYFSGPLFAHLNQEIPDFVKNTLLSTLKTKIYFAMGSSANHEALVRSLQAFDGLDVVVVAPIKSHLKESDKVPKNVMITDWLPALEVMRYVDFAVTHGGQGTVQTSVISGKPFIGIGMQPEQEINIYSFVIFGNALQISRSKITKNNLQKAIKRMIEEESFKLKALEAKYILESKNTYKIIETIVKNEMSQHAIY
jgi:UDP:flavonoid glycosyltransferase YjiC (YdhE family)